MGNKHEEGTATTHSSIWAWRTPWTEEPGGLQSMGSQRVRHDRTHLAHHTHTGMNTQRAKFKMYHDLHSLKQTHKKTSIKSNKIQDLHTENYTTLMKKIKEDLDIRKDLQHTLWKALHSKDVSSPQFDIQVTKSQQYFFIPTDKIILKCIWKGQRTRIAKAIFKKTIEEESFYLLRVITLFQCPKTMWYCQKARHRDWWKEENPHRYVQLIYEHSAKAIQRRINFSTRGAGAATQSAVLKGS